MPEVRVTLDDMERLLRMLWPPYGQGRRMANWLAKKDIDDLSHDWSHGRVRYADTVMPEGADA
jgi:hypothetical protein